MTLQLFMTTLLIWEYPQLFLNKQGNAELQQLSFMAQKGWKTSPVMQRLSGQD